MVDSELKVARPSKTLFVGTERCESVRRAAVEVSYHSGRTVHASRMLQYLIDNYLKEASDKLVAEIQKGDLSHI